MTSLNLNDIFSLNFTILYENVNKPQVDCFKNIQLSYLQLVSNNNKEPRTTSAMPLLLTLSLVLRILVSLLLTLNIFHILYNVKYVKIRAFYQKKTKKTNNFNRLQIEQIQILADSCDLTYTQGVLTGFYGILITKKINYMLQLEDRLLFF